MEISEDSNGTIWVGTATPHVAYLTEGADAFSYLQVFDGPCFIPAIRQIPGNNVLVAAFNQPMKCIDMNTREISLLPVSTQLDTLLKRSVFIPTDILPEDNGDLWIGTVGNGMLHYHRYNDSVSMVDGGACSDISAIQKDNSGNIWISTLFGMSRLDVASGRIIDFFDIDGIGGNQFYDRSKAASSIKDELVFGGTHGVTTFNPDNVTRHVEAPLMFQDLKVHNCIVRPGKDSPIISALALKPDINLLHDQNSFAISFVAVDFCENPRVAYKYMLEGVDPAWVESSQNHEAAYSNVYAGKYTFRVRLADDNDGSGEISLNVIVRPSP
ncbi:MAG: hybrid sensor histidine kinase/response regulator, partial [Muribaculaceae bacterium]|nr:hybrid sensor histidine kinase/response regulator [Muribaculaceae bacterium]